MAKGYNPGKAKEKQQARAASVVESNFGENVLGNLTREFEVPTTVDNQMVETSIDKLYSAPNNEEWDSFDKLSPDKEYELIQSIIDGGLIQPIIIWEINRDDLDNIYIGDIPKYEFHGKEYMILAGHSRANAFVKLYEATKEEKYLSIPSIIRRNISYESAKYIVKVTNYVNRELSTKAKREGVKFLHRTLSSAKTKGMNIAKKIAEDTGASLRSVQYQIAINEKLIPEFITMYDDGILSQSNILKILKLNESLQKWMYDKYKDRITNYIMKNFKDYFDRKELIDTLFVEKEIDYIDVTTSIPSHLDKKFRDMVKNWVKRNK